MKFVNTPIEFDKQELAIFLQRNIEDKILKLDNLIELIVFTPKGSFAADPDFGFEYWNNEYSNIHYRDFNNNHNASILGGLYSDITRKDCQESIKCSLETYEPQLKQIDVSIEINSIKEEQQRKRRKVFSKYEVAVRVVGVIEDGLGMGRQYEKRVAFFMEPTVKQITI